MICTRPDSTSPLETMPKMPPKWSMWLWVKMTATTGRSPRCCRYKLRAAPAVSFEMSGSITMTPVSDSMKLTFDRSNPRT